MSDQFLRTIDIDQLIVGMFITKLDISWLDSPFMTNTKLIKKQEEISALVKAGVKKLVIDISKGAKPDSPTAQEKSQAEALETPKPQPTEPAHIIAPKEVSLQQEMGAALAIRSRVKKAVDQLLRAFESDTKIEVEELTPLIDHTIESLERNDQALMSLVHLSRKSQKLADHSFGTFCLVLNLTKDKGIDEAEREQLGLAALMHEAGWSQIPLNLMGKRTRYTEREQKLVSKHVELGTKILARSELPELTMRIISEHHELLDGSGYPRGLTADQLHPLTHYLSVVDAYEERVHQLADSPGMMPHRALRSLYQDAESGLYCSEIVAHLISALGIFPVCSAVALNTGEKALVLEFHKDSPLSPTIKIVYDRAGRPLGEPMVIDLRKQHDSELRHIESALDNRTSEYDPARRLQLDEQDVM